MTASIPTNLFNVVFQTIKVNYSDKRAEMGRFERRSRTTRFNTVGGSDSGYASTVDENRFSHEVYISFIY